MPGIQLERLHRQVDELRPHFNDPARFVRHCHDLFEFYADRTRRPRRTGQPEPVIPAYRVAEPVLKRILFMLQPLARDNPEQALLLCDALWAEPVQEFRLLALRLLGGLDAEQAGSVVERVATWGLQNQEESLLDTLADDALTRLRADDAPALIGLAERLVAGPSERGQSLGLRILTVLLNAGEFENLPVIFRILTPRVLSSRTAIRSDVLAVLQQLAAQSPQETTYFLREMLEHADASKTTTWLVRHLLDTLPTEQATRLQGLLREQRTR